VDSLQTRVFAMLKELHARKQQLDRVIAALEALEIGKDQSTTREAAPRGNQPKRSKGAVAGPGDADA